MRTNAQTAPQPDLPFKLRENRVSYLVPGGSMIDRFYGRLPHGENNLSQGWVASVVESVLGKEGEGLSHLGDEWGGGTLKNLLNAEGEAYLGTDHLQKYGTSTGILLKLLHSDTRLLVQAHPDKAKALQYFGTPFGKTEAWYIVETAADKTPVVYAGFRPGVTRQAFRDLIEKQDTAAILSCLYSFPVTKGDAILIRPGTPHALGTDCLVAEIQEPSDLTLRAERIRPDGTVLPEESLHSGIGMEGLLDCFDFTTRTEKETRAAIFLQPETQAFPGGRVKMLVPGGATGLFSMAEIALWPGGSHSFLNSGIAVVLVLAGAGSITVGGQTLPLKKGDELFIPAGVREHMYSCPQPGAAAPGLALLECRPG